MDTLVVTVGLTACLAQVSLGGGLFEYRVVDPAWPGNPALIQPRAGGVNRKRFWIPAHVAFEASLVGALVVAWTQPQVRTWLLVALASHAALRIWSALDFIPKALAFERAEVKPSPDAARRWTRRSLARLPLALLTTLATMAAFATAAQVTG